MGGQIQAVKCDTLSETGMGVKAVQCKHVCAATSYVIRYEHKAFRVIFNNDKVASSHINFRLSIFQGVGAGEIES